MGAGDVWRRERRKERRVCVCARTGYFEDETKLVMGLVGRRPIGGAADLGRVGWLPKELSGIKFQPLRVLCGRDLGGAPTRLSADAVLGRPWRAYGIGVQAAPRR